MITKPSGISTLRFSTVQCLIGIVITSLLFSSINNAQSEAINQKESDELYLVIQNGKFGFINSKGVVVIKPQFLMASPFSEGLAPVLMGNPQKPKTAFIDTKGTIVIETYDSSSETGFSSGVAVLLADHSSSRYYIDKKGKRINGYYDDAEDCTEGLCAVRMQSMGPRHWGYINTSGETVIKGQYDSASAFSNGAARVCIVDEIGTRAAKCKIGFIGRSGQTITPIEFDGARDFNEDMAQVKLGDKWGYIGRSGAMIIPPQYEETRPFKNGLARVRLNGLWGFIDKSGHTVIPARFEFADDFYEDLAVVKLQKQIFCIDRTGRKVLTMPFELVQRFRNGVAIVCVDSKCGLMNKQGEVIVSLRFKSLEMVSDELIRVTDEKEGFGYMNYRGEFVWKPTH